MSQVRNADSYEIITCNFRVRAGDDADVAEHGEEKVYVAHLGAEYGEGRSHRRGDPWSLGLNVVGKVGKGHITGSYSAGVSV